MWADEPRPVFPGLFPLVACAGLGACTAGELAQRAVHVGQSGGTGPKSGPLRAMCVQGNTSENHRETVVSTANLSDVPCKYVPCQYSFPC